MRASVERRSRETRETRAEAREEKLKSPCDILPFYDILAPGLKLFTSLRFIALEVKTKDAACIQVWVHTYTKTFYIVTESFF